MSSEQGTGPQEHHQLYRSVTKDEYMLRTGIGEGLQRGKGVLKNAKWKVE
jgi:hypothetical protein